MPYDAPMPTEDIKLIERWIAAGASEAQCIPDDGPGCICQVVTECGGNGTPRCGGAELHGAVHQRGLSVKRRDHRRGAGRRGRDRARLSPVRAGRDQTCTSCHLSPSGGGLLNENGYQVAEQISQFDTNPQFFYDKLGLPDWLQLGGDARGQMGFIRSPQDTFDAFPMQLDVYAAATYKAFSLHVTVGYRPPEYGNEAAT